jgi:hypothetical protein
MAHMERALGFIGYIPLAYTASGKRFKHSEWETRRYGCISVVTISSPLYLCIRSLTASVISCLNPQPKRFYSPAVSWCFGLVVSVLSVEVGGE